MSEKMKKEIESLREENSRLKKDLQELQYNKNQAVFDAGLFIDNLQAKIKRLESQIG